MMGTPTQVATFQTCHTLKCLRKKLNCRQGGGWHLKLVRGLRPISTAQKWPKWPFSKSDFWPKWYCKAEYPSVSSHKCPEIFKKHLPATPPFFFWEVPKDLIIRTQTAKDQLHASGLVEIEMCGMRLWMHRICRFSESEVGNGVDIWKCCESIKRLESLLLQYLLVHPWYWNIQFGSLYPLTS